jgi:integrase/recombinase XerD
MIPATSPVVDSYVHHQRMLGRSEATIGAYRNALGQLQKHLRVRVVGGNGAEAATPQQQQQQPPQQPQQPSPPLELEWRDVTEDDLRAYWNTVKAQLATESAYLYLRVAKAFFRFLVQSHKLLVDPAENLPLPRLQRKTKRVGAILTPQDIERLMRTCDVATLPGLRDRAMLEFLYATAARISELRQVKVSDLDLGEGIARIQGKGGKTRIVPLGSGAVDWLRRYFSESRPFLTRSNVQVEEAFVSARGKPYARANLHRHIRDLGAKAGLSSTTRLTCHVLRRTVATAMLRNGASPAQVAALLGHENLDSLDRYVALAGVPDLKAAHATAHPRERKESHEEQ